MTVRFKNLSESLYFISFSLSNYLLFVLILLSKPSRLWKRTSSGWNMTSRERPMWGQSWTKCYGWRSSWMKPIRPTQSSTMKSIQMVRQRDSGQQTLTTNATEGNRLSQLVFFNISRLFCCVPDSEYCQLQQFQEYIYSLLVNGKQA